MISLNMNEEMFSTKNINIKTDCLNGCLCIAIVGENITYLEK